MCSPDIIRNLIVLPIFSYGHLLCRKSIELRGLASEKLLSTRKEEVNRELATAIDGIERNIACLSEKRSGRQEL